MDGAPGRVPGPGASRWTGRRLDGFARPGPDALGLSPGLYPLAASTGTGKTAIAGQIALHVAEHHGPVVFVSMELTDVDLAVRLVSVITNVKKEQLVSGKLTP